MRLLRPKNLAPGPSGTKQNQLGSKTVTGSVPGSKKAKYLKVFVLLLIVLAIAGGVYWLFIKDEPNTQDSQSSEESFEEQHGRPSEANIGFYEGTENVEEMRILVTSYVDAENLAAAVDTAKKVAEKTKEVQDYMTVLWVCALHEVPDKDGCINYSLEKLNGVKQSVEFVDAYSAGGFFEQAGQRQAAADFFQIAYDKYDPALAEEGIRTKEQLKSHIDELRG